MSDPIQDRMLWEFDCAKWRGKVLNGPDAHYCFDWDELPVDATTPEYDCCTCFPHTLKGRIINRLYMIVFNFKAHRVQKAAERGKGTF